MSVRIYHNPRCSKSRQTLQILQERDEDIEIIEYLKTPPTAAELKETLTLLQMSPRELARKGEAVYRELGLDNESLSDSELIDSIVANPILIERPIVFANGKAKIGRPPESVSEIL